MKTGGVQTVDVEQCLASAGVPRKVVACRGGDVIFSAGDDAACVMYILTGKVKLSISSRREVIVGVWGAGDFLGEECVAGQVIRTRKATALTSSTALVVGKAEMLRLLGTDPVLASRFMAHLLARNVRVEDDLIDQLESSCEQRLARTLLILAGYGRRGTGKKVVPKMSQTTLSEMVGGTRSQINGFLRSFKARGFVTMDGSLTVHRSLLAVVTPRFRRSLRDLARA